MFFNKNSEDAFDDLIEGFSRGDVKSYAEILKLISNKVMNIAYCYTHNLEDAKDIFQEVSFKIYKSLKFFRKKAKFSTWVYRVTVNACIDFLRKKKYTLELKPDILKEKKDPLEDIKINEKKAILKKTIDKLSKMQKNVFILKHYQGFKIERISRILGCSQSSVKTHLARAIDKLKKYLGEK